MISKVLALVFLSGTLVAGAAAAQDYHGEGVFRIVYDGPRSNPRAISVLMDETQDWRQDERRMEIQCDASGYSVTIYWGNFQPAPNPHLLTTYYEDGVSGLQIYSSTRWNASSYQSNPSWTRLDARYQDEVREFIRILLGEDRSFFDLGEHDGNGNAIIEADGTRNYFNLNGLDEAMPYLTQHCGEL